MQLVLVTFLKKIGGSLSNDIRMHTGTIVLLHM
jgi:hypothetical protein